LARISNTTTSALAEKQLILSRTREMLMKYGAKSVTMDDVAHELGISKKTLYKIAEDKSDLVCKCCGEHFQHEKANCVEIASHAKDAIDQMLNIFGYVSQYIANVNPSLIYDLQKYYPESWMMFENHKNHFVYSMVKNNISRGIKEGLYRKEINADIISKFYISKIEMMLDPNIFPRSKYSLPKIYKEYILHHLHGIVTQKGMQHLEKLVKSKMK
jgi:AcrR family transcriptional regulator